MPAAAQTPAAADAKNFPIEAIQAVRLQSGERITLDGTLSHPAWQRAPVHSRFVSSQPLFGSPLPQETRVQVSFEARAQYVGVTALDTRPDEIRAPIVRVDQVNRTQDFVVVYIDAIGTKRSAQFFRVNAAGSMADGLHAAPAPALWPGPRVWPRATRWPGTASTHAPTTTPTTPKPTLASTT